MGGDFSLSEDLRRRGVRDERTLSAIASLSRADFVPEHRFEATEDHPLGIGHGQTISQPYIVGVMTEALRLKGSERVLEIGTGSGYQTAILALLSAEVYSLEVIRPLHERARRVLEPRFSNVMLRHGDGYAGWRDEAPFDAIILTAAPPEIPTALVEQLAPRGVLVGPVGGGEWSQELVRLTKAENGAVTREHLMGVRFVPMTRATPADPGSLPA